MLPLLSEQILRTSTDGLQGLTDPKQIFQAATSTLAARRFDPPSAAIRVAPDAPKKIRLGASFASGGDSPRSLMILARLQSKRFSGTLHTQTKPWGCSHIWQADHV